VAAVPFYLFRGRDQWFVRDDWDFLTTRSAGSLTDLLTPHNEHWSTIPILFYRAAFNVVGLDLYWPYQIAEVLLHLWVAAMLWIIMRRAGVQPWVATLVASVFVFFGEGFQNILSALQMGFVAAVALGLTQLVLTDHDGPIDRRDYAALGCGVVALMCSGVAVAMLVAVGLAVVVRRGWRPAALQTVPPMVIYVVWWLLYARDSYDSQRGALSLIPGFVAVGLGNAFGKLGQLPFMGWLLAAVVAVGLVVAWWGVPIAELRRRAAVPAALLVGAVFFLTVTAYGRTIFGNEFARTSRYAHIVVAMLIPAIGVAIDALARRWRAAVPVLVVVLLLGVPGNIAATRPYNSTDRAFVLALPNSPLATQVPPSTQPDIVSAPRLTIGWLLQAKADGTLPAPGPIAPDVASTADLMLAVHRINQPLPEMRCAPFIQTITRHLDPGLFALGGQVHIRLASSEEGGFTFRSSLRAPVEVLLPIDVVLTPLGRNHTAVFCRPAG
jgi:hypothetical protein